MTTQKNTPPMTWESSPSTSTMLSTLPAPFWTDITQVSCADEAAGAGYGLAGGVRLDRQDHQVDCPHRPNVAW